jgi:hypothetical protein
MTSQVSTGVLSLGGRVLICRRRNLKRAAGGSPRFGVAKESATFRKSAAFDVLLLHHH